MNKRRTVEYLIKRVREELRAEGPDGSGYSDFIILDALNSALDDLSGIFDIRDTATFMTIASQQSYDMETVIGVEVFEIVRVTYDDILLKGTTIDHYLNKEIKTEGTVDSWFLWGTDLTLVGEILAGKTVKLWVNRGPLYLRNAKDVPETPRYVDEALIAFAMSVCYRESRDYDRANFHYRIYANQKHDLLKRSVPQGHRDHNASMQSNYWSPFRGSNKFATTDTNPGGN